MICKYVVTTGVAIDAAYIIARNKQNYIDYVGKAYK